MGFLICNNLSKDRLIFEILFMLFVALKMINIYTPKTHANIESKLFTNVSKNCSRLKKRNPVVHK